MSIRNNGSLNLLPDTTDTETLTQEKAQRASKPTKTQPKMHTSTPTETLKHKTTQEHKHKKLINTQTHKQTQS